MVARLEDLHALWDSGSAFLTGDNRVSVESAPGQTRYGQLLLARAGNLPGVNTSGQCLPGMSGQSLSLGEGEAPGLEDFFIADRVFAVIDNKGSIALRLPNEIADDLVDNGLCMRVGKNLLTWPPQSYHQFETSWRILLQAYWHVTGTPPKRRRRLWSEWVVNH